MNLPGRRATNQNETNHGPRIQEPSHRIMHTNTILLHMQLYFIRIGVWNIDPSFGPLTPKILYNNTINSVLAKQFLWFHINFCQKLT
jgi:hypothetical protein